MSIKWSASLVLLLVTSAAITACGSKKDQNKGGGNIDLPQTFQSTTGLTFHYPGDWVTREDESEIQIANSQASLDAMTSSGSGEVPAGMAGLIIFQPTTLEILNLPATTSMKAIVDDFAQSVGDKGTAVAKETKINGNEAARANFAEARKQSEAFVIAFKIDDKTIILAVGMARQGELKDVDTAFLKVIESITYKSLASEASILTQTFESNSGITFKYPDGWVVEDTDSGVSIANSQEALEVGQGGGEVPTGIAGGFIYDPMTRDATVQEVADLFAQYASPKAKLSAVRNTQVNGKEAARVDITDPDQKSEYFVIAFKIDNRNFVVVQGGGRQGELKTVEATLLAIVESITYTPPAAGPTPTTAAG